jgi:spore coat polysaccharide biosynthesis protein SpsF (cytidylyltransferase family)
MMGISKLTKFLKRLLMKPALAIIPCKTDSTRVKLKNLQEINNKTLLELSIEYAKRSEIVKDIFVSTESNLVKEMALKEGVEVLHRPSHLLADAEVCDVYVDALQQLKACGHDLSVYDYLIALQPDHPDRDNELDTLIEYAFNNKYDDLFTVSSNIVRTGSIRILKVDHALQGKVSRRVGCYKDDATNIHSLEDLDNATRRLNNKTAVPTTTSNK